MKKTFEFDANGALLVRELDADGKVASTRHIDAQQIPAHRLDADFDAALPADVRAQLDAQPAPAAKA